MYSMFQIEAHKDPFLRSIAYWVLEDYSRALDTLLEQPCNSPCAGATIGEGDAGKLLYFFFFFYFHFLIQMRICTISQLYGPIFLYLVMYAHLNLDIFTQNHTML